MTIEEITQTLQTVAENQATHSANVAKVEELQARHSADIAEMDRMLSLSLQSQNRYDERLAVVSDIMHTLADRQLKNDELFAENEKRFAQLADAQMSYEGRLDKLEASHELLEEFIRDFRNEAEARQDKLEEFASDFRRETNGYFTETDKKLSALAEAQAKTDEQMKRTDARVDTLTGDIATLNGRVDRIDEGVARVAILQSENAEQIKALIAAQTRTDEIMRSLLERNGSTAKPRAKVNKTKKKSGAKKSGSGK